MWVNMTIWTALLDDLIRGCSTGLFSEMRALLWSTVRAIGEESTGLLPRFYTGAREQREASDAASIQFPQHSRQQQCQILPGSKDGREVYAMSARWKSISLVRRRRHCELVGLYTARV